MSWLRDYLRVSSNQSIKWFSCGIIFAHPWPPPGTTSNLHLILSDSSFAIAICDCCSGTSISLSP